MPRRSLPGRGPAILKALMGGLAAVAAGTVLVVAATTGLGWLFAVSLEARIDIRPARRATPLDRLAWVRPSSAEPRSYSVAVESFASSAATWPFSMPVLDPLGALALMIPDSSNASDDRSVTASLGAYVPRRVAVEIISRPPDMTERGAATPLPRARPRLASLTPVDGIGIKPDKDDGRRRTAIYDIAAKVVYLPTGERLEAHSGLGELMDDPRSRNVKNRGVTPPNTYDLSLRESLFHGVQAIRLTPVNEKDMFGRDGILAHSYLLGPNGQSNGCVSFRDYPKFLNAFLRGEVDRIVVVSRLDKPPALADRSKMRSAANEF